MTWCPPIREEPRKLTLPPGKLGLTAKQYSDEFIITEVTSDDGMTLQGYHGTSPGNALRGMSIISVDGEELKSLVDLSTECDKSREVMVLKACISADASDYSKGELMYLKDIKCSLFDSMDYSNVEKKYGKEFLDELNPPQRKSGNQILAEALTYVAEYNFDDSNDDSDDEEDEPPLQFDTIFAPKECKHLSDFEKNIIFCMAEEENNDDLPTAISNHVMKGGRHYCTIKVTDNKTPCIIAGICRSMENFDPEFAFEHEREEQKRTRERLRERFPVYAANYVVTENMSPLYNVSTYAQWDSKCHACAYNAASGQAMWVGWDSKKDDPNDQMKYPETTKWNGMETLPPGSTLGLLLDLDEGTLTVYKNKRRLGVMKDGLEGSFCWFVGTFSTCVVEINREKVPTA
eukprot:scaffold22130_cov62-Cyclotella_meneghiniana.AAC.3